MKREALGPRASAEKTGAVRIKPGRITPVKRNLLTLQVGVNHSGRWNNDASSVDGNTAQADDDKAAT